MRILMIAAPLALLCACSVQRDPANDTTTVSFNEDVAANTAEDVGAAAQNLGQDIANDAQRTADKIENRVGDVDVDVNVSRDGHNDADHANSNQH